MVALISTVKKTKKSKAHSVKEKSKAHSVKEKSKALAPVEEVKNEEKEKAQPEAKKEDAQPEEAKKSLLTQQKENQQKKKLVYENLTTGERYVGSKERKETGRKLGSKLIGMARIRQVDFVRAYIEEIEAMGYEFVADGGSFNNFSIYKEESDFLDVTGLKSVEIERKRLMDPADERDMAEILEITSLVTIKDVCDRLGFIPPDAQEEEEEGGKKKKGGYPRYIADYLFKIDDAMGKGKSSTSNVVSEYAKQIQITDLDSKVKISHSAKLKAHKIVPQADWFPKSWEKDVDVNKLLALLPETEIESFMLALGRVLAGPSGITTAEGTKIEHTFRSFSLIVGQDAGLGKSSLFSTLGIIKMLEFLGFTVGVMSSDPNRFSWSDVVFKDLVYLDDLTDKSQSRLFTDATFKSVISNSPVKVDQKFLRANTVKARAACIANTNSFNYADYISMDSGFISRLNALATKRSQEIWDGDSDNSLFDMRPLTYWYELAAQLGTEVEGLALYLLRKSYELFMTTIGYDLKKLEGIDPVIKDRKADKLQATYLENRENYRIACDLKHKKELVRGVSKAVELTLAFTKKFRPKSYGEIEKKVNNLTFSYELLLPYIEFMLRSHNNRKGLAEMFDTRDIAWQSGYRDLYKKFIDFDYRSNNVGSSTPERLFDDVVSSLSTKVGFGFPKKRASYTSDWEQERFTFQINSERLGELIQNMNLDDFGDMEPMINEIRQLIEIC